MVPTVDGDRPIQLSRKRDSRCRHLANVRVSVPVYVGNQLEEVALVAPRRARRPSGASKVAHPEIYGAREPHGRRTPGSRLRDQSDRPLGPVPLTDRNVGCCPPGSRRSRDLGGRYGRPGSHLAPATHRAASLTVSSSGCYGHTLSGRARRNHGGRRGRARAGASESAGALGTGLCRPTYSADDRPRARHQCRCDPNRRGVHRLGVVDDVRESRRAVWRCQSSLR